MYMFCGVFVEDKTIDSNLHIYGDCNATLLFTSRKKTLTSVLLSGYVCSYIKTNGLFQYQTRTTEWFEFFFHNALRQSIIKVKNI